MQSRGDSPGSGMDDETLTRACEVLGDLQEWRLPPANWARPAGIVDRLADAWSSGDADAVDAATAALEMLSPYRVERMRDSADVPPPKVLRERVVTLIHVIAGEDTTSDDAVTGTEAASQDSGTRPGGQ
ncbi:CATRA system-associated protein [Streptomyces sp. NBC_00370]|uniref:CATRA system-associated protein n=1 Tax=Streptomyces sp. NBC_00370 TaxID=2975728 RepID=UPI002E266D19